jgi:hypothetical protein
VSLCIQSLLEKVKNHVVFSHLPHPHRDVDRLGFAEELSAGIDSHLCEDGNEDYAFRQTGLLILCHGEEAEKLLSASPVCSGIVAVGGGKDVSVLAAASEINTLILDDSVHLLRVFSMLQRAFDEHAQWKAALKERRVHGNDVGGMLKACAQYLAFPFCVVDKKLLRLAPAISTGISAEEFQKIAPALREAIQEKGNGTPGNVRHADDSASTACELEFRVGGKAFRAHLLHAANIFWGGFIFEEELRLDSGCTMETVMYASDEIMAFLLKEEHLSKSRDGTFKNFFIDVINGVWKSNNVIQNSIKSVNLSNKSAYYYGHIISKNLYIGENKYIDIVNSIKNIIHKIEYVIHSDTLHILVGVDKDSNINIDSLRSILTPIAKKFSVLIGLINRFNEFLYIYLCRSHPALALQIGQYINPEYYVHPYSFYVIYEILIFCSSHMDLKKFIHPTIHKLWLHDKKTGSEYVPTLLAYFNSDRKIVKAANHLGIHKNTFLYRMDKIKQISRMDFTQQYRTIHFIVSCSICKLLNRNQNNTQ